MSDKDDDMQSWGWTDLSSVWLDWEEEQTGIMSRRSLRLEENLDRTLPHSSASFSTGGASWRSSRSLRFHGSKQLSASCSESLLLPQTPLKSTGPSLLNSSLHSLVSDASLISSLLEESTMQESTLVDSLWGLDQDSDFKESATLAEDYSTAVTPPLSRLYCTNCEAPSSSCVSSVQTESEMSMVYSGGGKRKRRKNVLQVVGGAAARCFGLLLHIWQVCVGWSITQEDRRAARPAPLGVMNLKEAPTDSKDARPTGSLCDDCQEVHYHSSSSSSVLSFLRSSAEVTGLIFFCYGLDIRIFHCYV